VEALNHALRGIPEDRVRFHTCYGINEGPRVHDAPLEDIVDVMLRVNAGAYSFEAANARHEHEYHVWENVKLPDGKVLIPGVITHASNIVEHPGADRGAHPAVRPVGGARERDRRTDCGFSSQAPTTPRFIPRWSGPSSRRWRRARAWPPRSYGVRPHAAPANVALAVLPLANLHRRQDRQRYG